jgi:hypothetical protein
VACASHIADSRRSRSNAGYNWSYNIRAISDHWGNGREEGNIGRALQLNPEPTMIVARPIG